MKLDCEQAFFHSKVGGKADNKSVEHNFRALGSNEMNLGNKGMKGNSHAVLCGLNGHKKDVKQPTLAYHLDMEKRADTGVSMSKSVNDKADGEVGSALPCTHSFRETESVPNGSDEFCMDKSIPECVPEHVVKDICVDEGVPCRDKFLFETLADESKSYEACPHSKKEQGSELVEEVLDTTLCRPDEIKCLDSNRLDKATNEQCNFKYVESWEANDYATEKTADYDFKEKISPVSVASMQAKNAKDFTEKITAFYKFKHTSPVNLSLQETDAMVSQCNFNAHDSYESRAPCTQFPNSKTCSGVSASISNSEEPDNIAEAVLAMYQSSASEEMDQVASSKDTSDHHATENCTNILGRDSTAHPASSSGGECSGNDMCEHEENESAARVVCGSSDRWLTSNRVHNGDASFSATGGISGRISYSGPVPYSGSLSIRSDSSTTSTRSFAFPVLPSEWNSSPVRMAKADRRQRRKYRTSWRHCLLCCRF